MDFQTAARETLHEMALRDQSIRDVAAMIVSRDVTISNLMNAARRYTITAGLIINGPPEDWSEDSIEKRSRLALEYLTDGRDYSATAKDLGRGL